MWLEWRDRRGLSSSSMDRASGLAGRRSDCAR